MPRALDALGRWVRQSPSGLRLGSALGAFYIRLVNGTTRWRLEGREHFDRLLAGGTGVVVTMWHGRLFMSPYWGDPGRRTVAMISANRDGELITGIVNRFGIHTVRGSSYDKAKARDKGGLRAYVGARRELTRERCILGISPDGPRGPRMHAQPGAAQLAIETRCPVQPVTFSVRRGKLMRSWDRFLVPLPFGRGVQIWGEPLFPPEPGDPEAAARFLAEIEAALTAITIRADEACGRRPVLAAPLPDETVAGESADGAGQAPASLHGGREDRAAGSSLLAGAARPISSAPDAPPGAPGQHSATRPVPRRDRSS